MAAGQTSQKLVKDNAGIGGALGEDLHHLILIRAATNAGKSIKDGSNSAITVFVPGTLADLKPIYIPIYPRSIQGN